MNNDEVLVELNFIIERLEAVRDIMIETTRGIIDVGNVNQELMNAIDRLDIVIDSLEDLKEKTMLETAKSHITYASVDIIEDPDVFYKINRLDMAKNILMGIKTRFE